MHININSIMYTGPIARYIISYINIRPQDSAHVCVCMCVRYVCMYVIGMYVCVCVCVCVCVQLECNAA